MLLNVNIWFRNSRTLCPPPAIPVELRADRVASPVRAGLKSFFTRPFSQEKKCSYTAQKGPVVTGNNTLAQVFDFQAVATRHVRMHVLNNWGGSLVIAAEVAFEQVPAPLAVPEPGSLALAGLMAARRRRQSA